MKRQTGLVSIAMPVLNCENTVASAIRSIIQQTYENWELFIIDDGSSDRTVEIASQFTDERLRVLSDGCHKGLTVRLNESIELSRGKYYARIDGDDIAYPQRLQRQLAFLDSHPGLDLVGSFMMVFGTGGKALGKRSRKISRSGGIEICLRSIPLSHPTFLGYKDWFRQNMYNVSDNPFNNDPVCDQKLLIKTMATRSSAVVPEILLGYREEELTFSKQWRYRKMYFKSFRDLAQWVGVSKAILLLSVQLAKLVGDFITIETGLKYRILCNRASPIAVDEISEWGQVWNSVN